MADKKKLDNIKKLREITGVGFSDCKLAITETNGNIDKAIEYLRKKGIAKASKKMSRVAADGLILLNESEGNVSLIEINSETDFVAKNKDFITFCKEIGSVNFKIAIMKPINFDDKTPVKDITDKLNHVLEKMIIHKPEQWIWSHNRWK